MASPLSGVSINEVGTRYDLALGYDTGTALRMYGYTLVPGQPFTEATDIQDNQRIVQIGSPNSTDRFTKFPKVSQGDWSGGYRQVYFQEPTRFLNSSGMDTFKPGHLALAYLPSAASGIPAGITNTYGSFCAVGSVIYMGAVHTTPSYNLIYTDNITVTSRTVGVATAQVVDITYSPSAVYVALDNGNIYEGVATPAQVVNDSYVPPVPGTNTPPVGSQVQYFQGKLYYLGTAVSGAPTVRYAVKPWPGNAPGTIAATAAQPELYWTHLISSGNGLYIVSQSAIGQDLNFLNPNFPVGPAIIYSFDGTSAITEIAQINGQVVGAVGGGGTVYLLAVLIQTTNWAYTLYSISGNAVSVVDDTRFIPSEVETLPNPSGAIYKAGMALDGRFLWVSYPNWGVKIYDLASGAVATGWTYSAGDTITNIGFTTWGTVDWRSGVTGFLQTYSRGGTGSGTHQTSYFDFTTPTTIKILRSFEFELSGAAGSAPTVAYQLDNETGYPHSLTLRTTTTGYIGYFPSNTRASRIALQLTWPSGSTTAVRTYSLNARVGRVWKATVQCRRQQTLLDNSTDTQGVHAQDLLANLLNAYKLAAGNVTLFIPSPTQSSGTEQVNAVLEDYTLTTHKPGPTAGTEGGVVDMEADVELTLVESL